jgi:hypothetical protein
VEHNTWEYWDNIGNAAEAVNDFHTRNPGAPRRIRALAFGSIPFRPIPPLLFASGRCNSERGVIVRGTPKSSAAPQSSTASAAPPSLHSALRIQPHWFVHASPPPVHRTLRTLLFMVPLLFIIIVSHHSARPRAFLYMYLHQHGIPILSSSDPLLGVLIM